MQSASVGSLAINLVPGTGIRVTTSGFYLQMTGNWRYKTRGLYAACQFWTENVIFMMICLYCSIPISDHGSLDFKTTVDLSITGTSGTNINDD